jgi:hypothetical protein
MQKPARLGNPDQWRKDVRLKVETPVAKEQAIFQVRATRAVQHLLATLDSSVSRGRHETDFSSVQIFGIVLIGPVSENGQSNTHVDHAISMWRPKRASKAEF